MKKQVETMPTLKVLRLVKPCFRQKRLQQVKQKQSVERVINRSLCTLCFSLQGQFECQSECEEQKQSESDRSRSQTRSVFVIPLGLEPRTPTLKVLCSTN